MRVPQICLLATLTLTFFQQLSISVRAEDEVVCNEAEDVSDYRKYETGADVTWAQHRPLPAVPAIFPSERIKITVNGSVNTNRELYEVRECNWFGLHCWYEKRVRNNFVRPESIPLLWSLPEGSENGQISHSGATESPAVDWGDVPLTAARTLSAVVGSAANGINRLGCSGETPRCSVGAYNVTIEVDSGPRALRLLRDLSQTRLGYAAIQNENVLNSNLRASSLKVKACAAEGLLEQAKRFYGSAAGASERQKLLQEALNLNPTSKSAQTLLASTYLETGQFDEAKKTATVTAADNEKLIKAGRATAKTYVELAQNYATLAEVGWRETAGDSTKAALDAVGYLRLARDRLIDRLEKESRDLGELPEFSPDASRSLLTAYSARLSEVLARLGTDDSLLRAIEAPADTVARLPLRYSDATPFEVDATSGAVIAIRNREPIISDRSWTVDQKLLPLGPEYALTPFSFDSRPRSEKGLELVTFRYGQGRMSAYATERLINSLQAPVNILDDTSQCVSVAGRWGPQADEADKDPAVAVYHTADDKAVILPTRGATAFEVQGMRAVVSVNGTAGALRIAYVAKDPSKADQWIFNDGNDSTRFTEPADQIKIRSSPNGGAFAIGFEKKSTTKWKLVWKGKKGGADASLSTPIVCGNDNSETFDDLILTNSEVAGIGYNCPGFTGKLPADDTLPLRLTASESDRDLSQEFRDALKDRRASVAWLKDLSAPFAILSWAEKNGHALTSTYKLHIFPGKTPRASSRIQPVYTSNIAEWAAPESGSLTCAGASVSWAPTRHKFRITNVALDRRDEKIGDETTTLERPKVEIVAIGNIGSFASITSTSVRTARCDAAQYMDIQQDSSGRFWARSLDSALIRLNSGLENKGCEGAFKLPAPDSEITRVYRAPVAKEEPLQVFDLDAAGQLTTFFNAGSQLIKAEQPVDFWSTCSLINDSYGKCSAEELAAILGAPTGSQIRVLLRDISASPDEMAWGASNLDGAASRIRRPTQIAVSEPAAAGTRRVAFFALPLSSSPLPLFAVRAPESATPIGVLRNGDAIAGVFSDGSILEVATDELGNVQKMDLPAGWEWNSGLHILVGGARMLVSRLDKASKQIEIFVATYGNEGLSASPSFVVTSAASIFELAKSVNMWPPLTQGGRLEGFAVSNKIDRLFVPSKPQAPPYYSWAVTDLGAGPIRTPRAGAGLPLVVNGSRLLINVGSLVEAWELQKQ